MKDYLILLETPGVEGSEALQRKLYSLGIKHVSGVAIKQVLEGCDKYYPDIAAIHVRESEYYWRGHLTAHLRDPDRTVIWEHEVDNFTFIKPVEMTEEEVSAKLGYSVKIKT